MGTRADFYIGRGKDAEWLGSISYDGYPTGGAVPKPLLELTSESGFRTAVEALIAREDSGTTPDQGWPWPWDNSQTTDYAYAFDEGKVHASRFGHEWFDPLQEEPDGNSLVKVEFPDMTDRKNVTLGKRSGLLIVGI